MATSSRTSPFELRLAGGRSLPLDGTPLVMGILNVTPDSFSDGGLFLDPDAAVARAAAMAEEGADMIDVGAESSRPGSEPVDEAEEIRRLMPVLKGVLREVDLPISVDTTKAGVARRALDAGAALINDISALRFDPALGRAVAEAGAGLVLMHMRGTPKTMGQAGGEGDVVAEVREFFRERLRAAAELGVAPARILLDPGIGFGKNRAENLALIARLDEFRPLGRPLLIGVSRKTFIGELLGRSVGERLMGTAAAVAAAVLRGASIVRVHDVAAMRDVVRLAGAIREAEAGAVG